MTEIAQFRERAAKREREKLRDVQAAVPNILSMPSGPKQREWGKPGGTGQGSPPVPAGRGTPYNKTPGFVKAGDERGSSPSLEDKVSAVSRSAKSDEQLEAERKEARRRDEENSFKDVSAPSHLAWAFQLIIAFSVNAGMNRGNERAYKLSNAHSRANGR